MILPSAFVVLGDESAEAVILDDCACPTPFSPTAPKTELPLLIQRHILLQWLALDYEYRVAFVPSYSRVAVLNQATATLLDSFETARSWQDHTSAEIEALSRCYQLGLLNDGSQTIPTPPPSDTLVAWLHVTNACNLRCTYCYVDKTDEAMTADTAFAAIEAILRSAKANGYSRVMLKYAGGEASLNMPLVALAHEYACRRASEEGFWLEGGVLSNGTALTHHRLRQIQSLGLRLMISLDGTREMHDRQRPTISGHGSFRATVAGIERALQIGLAPDISITVTGQSVAGLPDLLRWVLERALSFSLNFYRPTDGSSTFTELQLDEQLLINGMRAAYDVIAEHPPQRSILGALLDRASLSAAHQRACAVGENYMVIDHQGRIAKCQMQIDRPVTTIGARDPLALIRADQIGVQNIPVDQKAGCRTCEWRYWCAGGCAVETFRATKRYDVKSPNCAIYKALYPDVLRLEGKRLLYHYQHRLDVATSSIRLDQPSAH